MSEIVPYRPQDHLVEGRTGDLANLFGAVATDPGYQWRDRNGRLYSPGDMETKHVFHTIKMIWNNYMPRHMAFWDARFYHFDVEIYSKPYLAAALVNLWPELMKRSLSPEQWKDLETMNEWMRKMREGLVDMRETRTSLTKREPKPLWDE